MKFTIITPCYNAAKTINDTILSILSQKGNFDIEYIVVDGKSTDETSEILYNYKKEIDTNSMSIMCNSIGMKIISEKDSGMYDALSKGLKCATGDIISYLNADDIYIDNALSTIADIMKKFPEISWVTSMPLIRNENKVIIETKKLHSFKKEYIRKGLYGRVLRFIVQEGTFWRNNLNVNINYGKLKSFKLAGDFYIWYEFSKKNDLYLVNAYLATFTKRENQLSSDKGKYYKEMERISGNINIFDITKASILRGVESIVRIFPEGLYRKTQKRYIYNENNEWKLKN